MIGREVSVAEVGKIGCFSVVGRRDSANNTWDYDHRPPRSFRGCVRPCTCTRGTPIPGTNKCGEQKCSVPGMSNGATGGNYFAHNGKLFRAIGNARCTIKLR